MLVFGLKYRKNACISPSHSGPKIELSPNKDIDKPKIWIENKKIPDSIFLEDAQGKFVNIDL